MTVAIRTRRLFALLLALGACGEDPPPDPPAATEVEDMVIESLDPALVVPGSRLVLAGDGFLPDLAGPTTLHLEGDLDGQAVSVDLPARFVDYQHLEVDWPGAQGVGLPASEGRLEGTAVVATTSAFDGLRHHSPETSVVLDLRQALTPSFTSLEGAVTYVNDTLTLVGSDFLLGGGEGQTVAVVEGCFTPDGAMSCTPVGPVEVPAEPASAFDREAALFPFSPHIAGITPGHFDGTVQVVNHHAGGTDLGAEGALTVAVDLAQPVITGFSPSGASLGQYVDIAGGGFVGPAEGDPASLAVTLVELEGSFTPTGGGPLPASITMIVEFVKGRLVRYVVNEEDELGQAIDVRYTSGTFQGTAQPVVEFADDVVAGAVTSVSLDLLPVKQVVWLRFLPSYVESLRHFGLREAESAVVERVLEVVRRDYGGINIDFRLERPDDFALYAEVEIGGPDPNGIGLLGYDNTPGKDDGNLRLYDRIGGVNALTQQDGYPGYGGVFIESLFVFSQHPGAFATSEGGEPAFDQLFDPFRPDRGGTPASASEVAGAPVVTTNGVCPTTAGRDQALGCAIYALGNLIGTTLSHEIAHSLGLADPGGNGFHNGGDNPSALMDAGSARTFLERAEVSGTPGGRFCQQNYDYLRQVLPSSDPDPLSNREACVAP
ncbi:MAG: hypothetical protein R3B72_47695 [Polyangiaceae bacterium]